MVVYVNPEFCHGGGHIPQAVAGGGGQQVLSALHIWSDGQLIKHVEEAFLTIVAPGIVYSGWIVVEWIPQ